MSDNASSFLSFAPILFLGVFALYFAPTAVAALRRHSNATSIAVLNVLLGWTVLGWVVALVWAFSSESRPQAATHGHQSQPSSLFSDPEARVCPFCDERIRKAAIKCKHCGSDLTTTRIPDATFSLPLSEQELMEKYSITFDREKYVFGDYKYDRLSDAVAYAQKASKATA